MLTVLADQSAVRAPGVSMNTGEWQRTIIECLPNAQ